MPFTARKHQAHSALSPATRSLHRAILTAFAETGSAPTRSCDDAALAELVERDLVVVDEASVIRAAYPFSAIPTMHRVTVGDGPILHAMCAIDALGVSTMLDRPVTIDSTDPGTGAPITVRVDGRNTIWEPDSAVVFAGSQGESCTPSADRTCAFINFFTTVELANAWAERHPGLDGAVLSQNEALTRGIAEFRQFMRVD